MIEPQRFILDTSALLRHPEILALAGRRKLVIPEAVLRELYSRSREESRTDISSLIKQAISRGAKIVSCPVKPDHAPEIFDGYSQRFSDADIEISRIAASYAERFGAKNVVVITLDRALQKFISRNGINSITGNQFLHNLIGEEPDPEIERSAKSYAAKQWKFSILSILLGLASSWAGNLGFAKLSYLIETVSVWGTMIALPILGVILYWYRQKFRLAYGIFEFIVGVMMAYYVFFPEFSYAKLSVVQGMQILGGLYVMVRGLDNVSKGVEGTRVEVMWKRWFS